MTGVRAREVGHRDTVKKVLELMLFITSTGYLTYCISSDYNKENNKIRVYEIDDRSNSSKQILRESVSHSAHLLFWSGRRSFRCELLRCERHGGSCKPQAPPHSSELSAYLLVGIFHLKKLSLLMANLMFPKSRR